jgi:hypothetical protein
MEFSKRVGSLPVRQTPINSTYFIKFWSSAKLLAGAVGFTITRILLKRIGCNTVDKQGNAYTIIVPTKCASLLKAQYITICTFLSLYS